MDNPLITGIVAILIIVGCVVVYIHEKKEERKDKRNTRRR